MFSSLLIGFQIDAGRYFIFFLTLFLTSFAAIALAFWISAGVRVAGIGNLLVALSFVVQMVRACHLFINYGCSSLFSYLEDFC